MAPADRILGAAEICAITGKRPRTVRRWFQEGRLRRVKFAGVVGCWESELVVALGWRGTGSLIIDDPIEPDLDGDDALDALKDDVDADLV
jgi:hypothetical protein